MKITKMYELSLSVSTTTRYQSILIVDSTEEIGIMGNMGNSVELHRLIDLFPFRALAVLNYHEPLARAAINAQESGNAREADWLSKLYSSRAGIEIPDRLSAASKIRESIENQHLDLD